MAIIRKPVVAGRFYPASAEALKKDVARYIDAAAVKSDKLPRGLIAPHAGYACSGPVAGAAYRQLAGRAYEHVVVISASHSAYLDAPTYFNGDAYQTPLGDCAIDAEAAEKIAALYPDLTGDAASHSRDHSIEVHLPFLQHVIGLKSFTPIMIGRMSADEIDRFGKAIAQALPENTLVVASSDLSHYPPYSVARRVDAETLKKITAGDIEGLLRQEYVEIDNAPDGVETYACGTTAIAIAITCCNEWNAAARELITYQNSGDTCGDHDRVVGYGAVAFYA